MKDHLNDWVTLNKVLTTYKAALLFSGTVSLLCLAFAFYEANRPPVVVLVSEGDKRFLAGTRKPLEITKKNIEDFLCEFVRLRYSRKTFDRESILGNIAPMVTGGLAKKMAKTMKDTGDADQRAVNIEVEIVENGAWLRFDLVVKINGVALVTQKTLFAELVKGKANVRNPLGIYIDKIIVYEEEGVK